MSAVAAPLSLPRPAMNPWVVAAAVVIPTFMEILDTTIANVSLRYIAGGLSASETDSEWVITSYLAANAVVLPMSGWLSVRLGRRNYFVLSILLFTISSGLCGMAGSLSQLIFFRVMQGLGGGGLQPSSQAILLDSFPAEKQGAAMTIYGVAGLMAPVVGPTLGGWITVDYNWRWIFYINLPIGLLAAVACYAVARDPDYLRQARERQRRSGQGFDFLGLGFLVVAITCWEVTLSKGQEWNWFGDPFWRIQILVGLLVVAVVGLIVWELRRPAPLVNFRVFTERNFVCCSLIIFAIYGILYGASTSLPALLQTLFTYDALQSGLDLSPAGIFAVVLLPIIGFLLGRRVDARWLIATGLVIISAGTYWMSLMNLQISPMYIIWPRVVLIVGLTFCFAPLNVAAYKYMPVALRGAAVGLFSLLRNEGGSVGTSVTQTIQERRAQFHTLRLNEFLDPLNPAVTSFGRLAQPYFYQQNGDPALSRLQSIGALATVRDQQANALAYFDCFWFFSVVALGLILLVFLMKPSAAEKGQHAGAE